MLPGSRQLIVPLPQVNLAEEGAAGHLGGEVHHVRKRVGVQCCDNIEAARTRDDMILYLSKALNSASAAVSFSAPRPQNLEATGGSVD